MTFVSDYQPRPLEATFGYFNSSCSKTENMKKMHSTINLMNGLGYIPIIGTIVGIARILFFSKFIPEGKHHNQSEQIFSSLQVGRGCIELFSFGAIFLIPDLIFTLNRELELAMAKKTWFHSNFGTFKNNL